MDDYFLEFICPGCGWTAESDTEYGIVNCPFCPWKGDRGDYIHKKQRDKPSHQPKQLHKKREPQEQEVIRNICKGCEHFTNNGYCSLLPGCAASKKQHYDHIVRRGICPIQKW